ncbi:MAG: MerR family transcriptional regulator [Gammaproteobacteria bacterium]|nr:MAG: MerR family transcriptional regulator [Gammaproteobacteria bacterium]|tara:strand:- start:754 stop:1080 length:327 start_codon:yes stop_codon:yes gene_type:complete
MTKLNKKYYSISEVSEICDLKPHTLRFWEKEFKQISPQVNKGGRRRYQRKDIQIINQIRKLLQDDGLTISGAKKKLAQKINYLPKEVNSKKIINELERILAQIKNSRS